MSIDAPDGSSSAATRLQATIAHLECLTRRNLAHIDSDHLLALCTLCARCDRLIGDELAKRHHSRHRDRRLSAEHAP